MSIVNAALTLKDLPPPPFGKTGWPWTEESQPLPERMSNGSEWLGISIVTPSYNQGQFLEEAIRSVLLQNYPNLTYIIIDGGSTDNSVEIIKKYQKYLSYWVSEPDKGPADAINKGWNRASSDIIAYLNSDDAYLPGSLCAVAQAFQEREKALAICGSELTINREGFVTGITNVEKIDHSTLLNLNFIPQPATFLQKSILNSVGLLTLEVKYIFDFELWLRITRLAEINCVSNVLAVTRWHEQTITLTQKPKIGDELVYIITHEVENYSPNLAQVEKCNILFKVKRLALELHLESDKFLISIIYAVNTLILAPRIYLKLQIIKKYLTYFKKKIKLLFKIQKRDVEVRPVSVHWSTFVKVNPPNS